MEEAFLATLEGMAESIENREELLVLQQEQRDTLMILCLESGTRGKGEGNRGGGEDEPIDSE